MDKFTPYPNDTTTMEYDYAENGGIKTKRVFHKGVLDSVENHYKIGDTVITEKAKYQSGKPVFTLIRKSLNNLEIRENITNIGNSSKYFKEDGRLIKEIYLNSVRTDEIDFRYSFEYDHNQNWTKCETYRNGKLVSVTLRKIEYY